MNAVDPQPYVFAISDLDAAANRIHALISQKLQDAGFDVGFMLWTACPYDYTNAEKAKFWKEAFERAGIEGLLESHDESKQRTWYKVYRKQP